MLTDTHSHMYEPEFDADRADAVERARRAGVGLLLMPAIDAASDERMFAMAREYAGYALPMMGLHPTSVNDNPSWRDELARVERLLASPPVGVERFVGVGEIGLDLHWSRDWLAEQREAFVYQLELSLRFGLPAVIHTRDAWAQMCDIMESFRGRGLRGVFHAFSGDAATCRRLLGCGDFLFGIGGTVTYKKSTVPALLEELDLSHVVLETDCPYLSPVPYRGQRNESAYVALVCGSVARTKGMDPDEVARITTANALKMFGIHTETI